MVCLKINSKHKIVNKYILSLCSVHFVVVCFTPCESISRKYLSYYERYINNAIQGYHGNFILLMMGDYIFFIFDIVCF